MGMVVREGREKERKGGQREGEGERERERERESVRRMCLRGVAARNASLRALCGVVLCDQAPCFEQQLHPRRIASRQHRLNPNQKTNVVLMFFFFH